MEEKMIEATITVRMNAKGIIYVSVNDIEEALNVKTDTITSWARLILRYTEDDSKAIRAIRSLD